MEISDIRKLVAKDLVYVDEAVNKALHSSTDLIPLLSGHLIHSGGKRLRPLVVLLGAHALAYQGSHHIALAASLELIHTATLLHDDVVDDSNLRRNKATANAIWGNAASVLVGGFLYSRAFELMANIPHQSVLCSLAHATNRIAEGEVLQLVQTHNLDMTEQNCLEIIQAKTGLLFECAAIQGALLTEASAEIVEAMAFYGKQLGIAFQLVDDALDYSVSSETLGKQQGDDLAEGKITLPLLYALKNGTKAQVTFIQKAVQQREGRRDCLEEVLAIIESTGAITYTYKLAKRYANEAIACLRKIPDSVYKEALTALTAYALKRSY